MDRLVWRLKLSRKSLLLCFIFCRSVLLLNNFLPCKFEILLLLYFRPFGANSFLDIDEIVKLYNIHHSQSQVIYFRTCVKK